MIDIAIIGGGPAGLAAGMYAARGGANAVLFEEVFVGGQAAKTMQIDNYPGFAEGINGSELGMRMEQHAARFGLNILYTPVQRLTLLPEEKVIHMAEESVQARAVILCMGASPRKLGLPREDALEGRGISYCATCDGAFFKEKDVAVVGGGDTALSDALYLARFAKSVTLIHRRDALRGGKLLQDAVLQVGNITILWNHVVTELLGEERLAGLRLQNTQTGAVTEQAFSALFVAVGVEPRTSLVNGQVALSDSRHILTDFAMQTDVPGVYAAGDIRETPLRQVVTAVADGAVAATGALEYISLR